MKVLKALLATALVTGGAALAAELRTEHTYALADGEKRPAATLEDASFLVGSWTGTAFGERMEESWSAPTGGSMVGTFKLFNGDEPAKSIVPGGDGKVEEEAAEVVATEEAAPDE